MRRTAGWSVLAITALELGALALTCRLIGRDHHAGVPEVQPRVPQAPPPAREPALDAVALLATDEEAADEYYRASDVSGELVAAFYADGRVRLTGPQRAFAGILQDGQADMLDVTDNTWSELFVRSTPQGDKQLELRGGVYGGRIFTCERIAAPPAARFST